MVWKSRYRSFPKVVEKSLGPSLRLVRTVNKTIILRKQKPERHLRLDRKSFLSLDLKANSRSFVRDSLTVYQHNSGDAFSMETTTVTYTATDSGSETQQLVLLIRLLTMNLRHENVDVDPATAIS